ncbi:O-acyltransferase WSD1 C-terminal [Arabidopsis thaliana x Arabidopsis arenosa]|uniref:O-acyltransferase WSD1 C-terminal n=1 Tax=Arabidopsis thaliana x Arabidopsis arenosa TaxID=1240361 RepID=A0A8T1YDA6_9BRAS|nr:O-acyltransferase WSD1 C-terminal [Arabidopsis thaliana x Arabidopsis arenosa]
MSVEDENEEPLSPMARLFQSPGNDCCIITMIGCKTKINADVILRALKLNVSKHPRFSSKLSDDGACWIKTQVNVENHVFVPDIDQNKISAGSDGWAGGATARGPIPVHQNVEPALNKIGEDGEGYVEDYVSRLTMLPLDKSRPLWDMHILNVKTIDAEAVCVIRSHHSLGDGTSLMSLLIACTQKTSHRDTFPTSHVLKQRKTALKDKVPWFLRWVLAVFSLVRLICNTFVDILLLLATALFLKDTNTPLKGDVGVENNQKRFCHRIVSLDDIKLIKEVMNMTINDVLLGVTQAALSRYLNSFPGKIRLTAGVFVNLRSDNGIQAKSAIDRKKHSLQAALAYSATEFIFNTFSAKVGAILPKRHISNTTTFISNLIGPMEEINFLGHPIAYIAPSVYGHAHALTIHFLSYAEKMVISIGVDPTVIQNPHKLCDEMEDSLEAMKATLSERGLI